jgi:hypothetical protein
MNTLALPGSRAWAATARAKAGMLKPLTVCMALFASVLATSFLSALIPIATTIGQMVIQGSHMLSSHARTDIQSPWRNHAKLASGTADRAHHRRPTAKHRHQLVLGSTLPAFSLIG